ncbi:MAG TPA: DUF3667 domain-containing protein [Longimicrobiales bacterium]|nr:DUF3667 domain-containing protein [Longimicrobiales bacterium]
MPPPETASCVTCGTVLAGSYCHACGEKQRDASDLTLRAFAGYALEAVTNADARLYRTVRTLVTRPGLLTREYVAGRRKPYMEPLQLFLLVNVLYFLTLGTVIGTSAFTTDLAFHPLQPLYGPLAAEMLEARVGAFPERGPGEPMSSWTSRWTEEQVELRQRFAEASPRYANSLVILMVPMFALALRVLRRRTTFIPELVFSLHFFVIVLALSMTLPAFLLLLHSMGMPGMTAIGSDAAVALVLFAGFAAYLASAFRRVHGDGKGAAIARSLAAVLLLFFVVTIYRGILFVVVFHAV